MKTLDVIFKEKKILAKEMISFLIDKKMEIIGNSSRHIFAIGDTVMVSPQSYISGKMIYYLCQEGSLSTPYGISLSELRLIEEETVEEINTAIKCIEERISKEQEKIEALEVKKQFLIDNNLERFDELAFKIYKTLKVLKKGESDIDTAIKLSKLFS